MLPLSTNMMGGRTQEAKVPLHFLFLSVFHLFLRERVTQSKNWGGAEREEGTESKACSTSRASGHHRYMVLPEIHSESVSPESRLLPSTWECGPVLVTVEEYCHKDPS